MGSSGCETCPTGCAECTSSSHCSKAVDGYYLLENPDGSYNGQWAQCNSPAATCRTNPNFALSCISGYTI